MRAEVVEHGTAIEVLGFVVFGWELHAVCRDDAGSVYTIAASRIRMVPHTDVTEHKPVVDDTYPAPDNWWCEGCGSWFSEDAAQRHMAKAAA